MANNIQAGSIKNVKRVKMPFQKMEYINVCAQTEFSSLSLISSCMLQHYLDFCTNVLRMKPSDQFQTVDLYEKKNKLAVIVNLLAVKRLKP